MKCIMLCNCLFFFSFLCFCQPYRNLGEFGAKKYFIDHQTANYQLFVHIKRKLFRSILFQNKLQAKRNSPGAT